MQAISPVALGSQATLKGGGGFNRKFYGIAAKLKPLLNGLLGSPWYETSNASNLTRCFGVASNVQSEEDPPLKRFNFISTKMKPFNIFYWGLLIIQRVIQTIPPVVFGRQQKLVGWEEGPIKHTMSKVCGFIRY